MCGNQGTTLPGCGSGSVRPDCGGKEARCDCGCKQVRNDCTCNNTRPDRGCACLLYTSHYANYIKGKFVKKRGEQFSLSENSFIEMIHSKKCEK